MLAEFCRVACRHHRLQSRLAVGAHGLVKPIRDVGPLCRHEVIDELVPRYEARRGSEVALRV